MRTVCFKLIDYKLYNSPTCKVKNKIYATQIIYSFCWYLGGIYTYKEGMAFRHALLYFCLVGAH